MPSRRQFVGVIGTAMALSGCSALESATSTETEQSVSTAITARLLGPETDQQLFDGSEVARVGEVNEDSGTVQLPITLTDAGQTSLTEQFRSANVSENSGEFEMQLLDDGEEFHRFGIGSDLATAIEGEEWNGKFVIGVEDRDAAEAMRSRLLGEGTETPEQ
ncbi:hypothetical protein EGH22_01850 [Halomicroarcula sp. F28]|uniref:hypothetical protein n=1 Tax=Haloarcula salinisoli TaxID=2487746 RepID=UPI001C737CE6|nr:hypothetical protein [Halomicroarcula salinisoli]MBX0285058.1 hypothetical protein [Halomicroarcula salinisoli]